MKTDEVNYLLKKSFISAVAICAGIFIIGIVFCAVIAHSISKPIIRLKDTAESITRGKQHNNNILGGNAEISSLSNSVNTMARSIADKVKALENEIKVRTNAEEELLHHKNNLEKTVAEQTEDLRRSNEELEQFASIASHDLQEPLRKIVAFGSRLEGKCNNLLSDECKDYLRRMQSAASRMQALITGLLSYSRISSNGAIFEPVDLNLVINLVLEDLEIRIHETNTKIEICDLPTVEGDEVQLRQLFQNLICNAIKYMPVGTPPHIQIDYGRAAAEGDEEDLHQISVIDNGIGFDQKYAERIFGIFQRLHGKQEYSGTGLGLAVCYKIIQRHGGDIWADSTPGEGATFTFTLSG